MVAKLTDVAKLAGVSPTTVSRVINKRAIYLRKPSKRSMKPWENWAINPITRSKAQGKSAKLIGLIFPNISHVFMQNWLISWNTNSSKMAIRPSSVTANMTLRKNGIHWNVGGQSGRWYHFWKSQPGNRRLTIVWQHRSLPLTETYHQTSLSSPLITTVAGS